MKKVFDNASVATIFVAQTQQSGRNSSGSIYFEGNEIYSYGSHFCIAKIVGDTVLLTTRTHSVTTARHVSIVRSAIRSASPSLSVIEVENPLAASLNEITNNIEAMREDIADTKGKAKRSRKYKDILNADVNAKSVNLINYRVFIQNIVAKAA